ncbi:ABC transporter permease [Duganella sp. BJB488]|uniref:MlaE family ABC transporter permease n=1 Tax=unclassified Duganella TaxID=2636909 RepID=UPI000E353AA8|nr:MULTISPECIES: ABC transporter permease [unclassified Duganella]NVD72680.1 ABC transporter permease [Duganella sp. BJB1802]RFP20287.1 ABC transporter permease [Duganella sp. BJB489]RFP21267.1 ABC transporter permease [Duganella sp. BJB488]RFP33409.1 ABC transporter permease [Duganella sp. BJB480]
MSIEAAIPSALRRLMQATVAWLNSWWRLLQFAARMLSLAFAPASYRGANLNLLARRIVRDTAPNLAWYGVLSALVSLVLIRIVVVTSQSYGLSRFALEMVVRVLVLELIPLTAAAFVALRTTLPEALEYSQSRSNAANTSDAELHQEFFPRVASGVFAVWMLAAVSCVTTLILAYLSLYGFTPWALPGYTRVVGQVFNPAVALILVLKIVFFSFAVGLIPMASSYYFGASYRAKVTHGLYDMVRLFAVMLLIEIASLMGNYY